LFDDIIQANENYDLKIKAGIELGYFQRFNKELHALVNRWPFDYVVGSIHFVNDIVIADQNRLVHPGNLVQWYRDYYMAVIEMLDNMDFDCLAHIDIVKKTAPPLDIRHYSDLIDDMIALMKKRDIGFELNTMGWWYDCKEQFPSVPILQKLCKAGIRKVTIGSDCHTVDKIDYKLKEGLELLKRNGFREICTFTRRKPEYHPL